MSLFVRWRRAQLLRRNDMKLYPLFISVLLLFSANVLADGAKPPKAKPQTTRQPAEPQQKVEYADLGGYIGKHITVHTTLGTVRSGTLKKFSNTSIDLKTETGVDLTLPSDTIRSVSVALPPPDPLTPGKGDSGGH